MAAVISAVFLIVATVIIQIVLRPKQPDFQLSGFSVSNLTFTNDLVLLANWEANVTAENWNGHIRLKLASVVYHGDPERYLSWMDVGGPLFLGARSSGTIDLKMITPASEQPDVKAMEALRDELQSDKTVSFGLEMEAVSKFRYSWVVEKNMHPRRFTARTSRSG